MVNDYYCNTQPVKQIQFKTYYCHRVFLNLFSHDNPGVLVKRYYTLFKLK